MVGEGWNSWLALVVRTAVGAATGVAVERTVAAQLARVPRVIEMVATIGLAQPFACSSP